MRTGSLASCFPTPCQGHGHEITGDPDDDHQHGGQNRMAGYDQAHRQKEHRRNLLDHGVEGISQNTLERDPTFLDSDHDALD